MKILREVVKPHPGSILRENFMMSIGIDSEYLSKKTGIHVNKILRLVKEDPNERIGPKTAQALSKYFRNTQAFWLNLQNNYDRVLYSDT